MQRLPPVLISAGPLSRLRQSAASSQLTEELGVSLKSFAIGAEKPLWLDSEDNGVLLQLCGDAAAAGAVDSFSCLEILALRQQPVVILVSACEDGTIPGIAPAYTALCKQLSVRLIGLVQLGGSWKPDERRRDGLPWCGWIPEISPISDIGDQEALVNLADVMSQRLALIRATLAKAVL